MDDAKLVEGLRAGSRTEFATLVERYARQVYPFLARVSGTQAAEDLTQRAFAAAWRGARAFHSDRPLRVWVMGHAVRAAAEHEGFDGRWGAAPRSVLGETRRHDAPPPPADPGPDTARFVALAVTEMPFPQRVVLVLKAYFDYGIPEICATLDTSGDNVQALLTAAYHSFVKRLSRRAGA